MSQIKILSPQCFSSNSDIPRLGMIVLATDLTVERDVRQLITPDEAVVHVSRIPFENPTTPASLQAMGPNLTAAADLLVPGVDLAAIAFACTSASVTIRNEVVSQAIAKVRPHIPVVTPSSATLAAFQALGVRRIALLTPYLVETTAPMVGYFEEQDIQIEKAACFNMADDREMARIDDETMIEAAVSIDSPQVDAVFLSCTALPALNVINAIEARIGKPVVSSNQATLWALRGLVGLPPPEPRIGRLFDKSWPKKVNAP
jgi:maleate isomerase